MTRKEELAVLIDHQRRQVYRIANNQLQVTASSDSSYLKGLKESVDQLENYISEYNAVKYKEYPNDTN